MSDLHNVEKAATSDTERVQGMSLDAQEPLESPPEIPAEPGPAEAPTPQEPDALPETPDHVRPPDGPGEAPATPAQPEIDPDEHDPAETPGPSENPPPLSPPKPEAPEPELLPDDGEPEVEFPGSEPVVPVEEPPTEVPPLPDEGPTLPDNGPSAAGQA